MRKVIKSDPQAPRRARTICEAAGLAFQPAIELLVKHGADLNATWRGYRPLHNLIQTNPHEASGKPSAERLRCLEWMISHGADPEQTGAWPPARAIIIAAFGGQPEYVRRLRRKGDTFAAAALADKKLVEATLRKRPDFARDRDAGGLTALQCALLSQCGHWIDVCRSPCLTTSHNRRTVFAVLNPRASVSKCITLSTSTTATVRTTKQAAIYPAIMIWEVLRFRVVPPNPRPAIPARLFLDSAGNECNDYLDQVMIAGAARRHPYGPGCSGLKWPAKSHDDLRPSLDRSTSMAYGGSW